MQDATREDNFEPLTPARTLVISRTRMPVRGKESALCAAVAKLRHRCDANDRRFPLARAPAAAAMLCAGRKALIVLFL